MLSFQGALSLGCMIGGAPLGSVFLLICHGKSEIKGKMKGHGLAAVI